MKISLQQLHDMQACQEGIARFKRHTSNTQEPVDVATLVSKYHTYLDLLWLAEATVSPGRLCKLVSDSALLNLELVKPYVSDVDYEVILQGIKTNRSDSTLDSIISACLRSLRGSCNGDAINAMHAINAACHSHVIALAYAKAIDKPAVDALLVQLFNEVE